MQRGSYSSEGEDMDATPLAIGYYVSSRLKASFSTSARLRAP
jgi:hypothetical protein